MTNIDELNLDALTDKEAVDLAIEFIADDIQAAFDVSETACDGCLISHILQSYDQSLREGIAIGLSIACGFGRADEPVETSQAFHWLKHIVKIRSSVTGKVQNDQRGGNDGKTAEIKRIKQETNDLAAMIEQNYGWKMEIWQKNLFETVLQDGRLRIFMTRGDQKK